jgi:phosphonopyruvate decarboxylase
VLLIITLRGEPGLSDEPQHELMGQITGRILDELQIPWDWFPKTAGDVEGALTVAQWQMDKSGLPYAFVMRKGSVAPVSVQSEWRAESRFDEGGGTIDFEAEPELSRSDALRAVIEATPEAETVVIGTTGYTGRELFALADRPNQLYMVGSMGCAGSLGLGLALARPDRRIVVVDGDGAALMRMGHMAVVGAYGEENFHHLLLDNGVHESTGGQATVSGAVRFAGVARHCGYRRTAAGTGRAQLESFLEGREGPSLLHLGIRRGVPDNLPRPDVSPRQVRSRLMKHIGAEAPWSES